MKHGIFYVHGDFLTPTGLGWYWEEWTDGVLEKRGWHNGSCPPGRDATWSETQLCYTIY